MKFYSYPAAPNPRRLHIFMAEKGIDIPWESVDLMKGEQFRPEFLAVNPGATVPALVTDEGEVLTQVVAICDYLEALYPAVPLMGSTPLEKGLVREWSTRMYQEGTLAVADVFRNTNPAFAGRSLPGQASFEQLPVLAERGLKRLELFWQMLDAHLAGRDFMVGDRFTMADIDALAASDFGRWIRKPVPEQYANIHRWRAAICERPSVKAFP